MDQVVNGRIMSPEQRAESIKALKETIVEFSEYRQRLITMSHSAPGYVLKATSCFVTNTSPLETGFGVQHATVWTAKAQAERYLRNLPGVLRDGNNKVFAPVLLLAEVEDQIAGLSDQIEGMALRLVKALG